MPKTYAPMSLAKSKYGSPPLETPPLNASSTLVWSLAHEAEQSQYLGTFWSSFLPNGQAFSSQAALYSTARWFCVVQEQCEQDDLVRYALLANALGVLGEARGQRALKVQGVRAYGRCINLLARLIPTKLEEKGDEMIAASTLLAFYEV